MCLCPGDVATEGIAPLSLVGLGFRCTTSDEHLPWPAMLFIAHSNTVNLPTSRRDGGRPSSETESPENRSEQTQGIASSRQQHTRMTTSRVLLSLRFED